MDQLQSKFESRRDFLPYIESIRFPYYKNLSLDLRIEFQYPITAIIGPNGCNKSSILHALAGAPYRQSLSRFWFSTKLDDIDSQLPEGEEHRFIYEYMFDSKSNVLAECRKARVTREYRSKNIPKALVGKKNPDYWESAKAVGADGMRPLPEEGFEGWITDQRSRWEQIRKNVLYFDFRAELSAFDKYTKHSPLTLREKTPQDRSVWAIPRAARLARLFNETKPPKRIAERIFGSVSHFTDDEVSWVSDILGRRIDSILMAEHSIYGARGFSIVFQADSRSYSEAHAGSGEFAVARLVREVARAETRSLILLDEPEVSLHPKAQLQLMRFLQREVLRHGHQIVLATHSPVLVSELPSRAIKVLGLPGEAGRVQLLAQECAPESAFLRFGGRSVAERRVLYVEDDLAKLLVETAINARQAHANKVISVEIYPGGSGSIISNLVPSFATGDVPNVAIMLDGDRKSTNSASVDVNQEGASTVLDKLDPEALRGLWRESFCKSEFPKVTVDSGTDEARARQEAAGLRKCILWAKTRLGFLPGHYPEQALRDAVGGELLSGEGEKAYWVRETREALGCTLIGDPKSSEILSHQRMKMGSLAKECELFEEIDKEVLRLFDLV